MKTTIAFFTLLLTPFSVCAHEPIQAVYLGSNTNEVGAIFRLLEKTEINSVVIDIKDSAILLEEYHERVIAKFREENAYVICRLVVFQDTVYARAHPDLSIRRIKDGEENKKNRQEEFWWSGKKEWKRYWIDPAIEKFWDYNLDIALRGIKAGCQEINFDYIRYPSDGNMKNMIYPTSRGRPPTKEEKRDTMKKFFAYITRALKAQHPEVLLSIDIFGYVFRNGQEEGIGQHLEDLAKYFDVISPMAYPSHYFCGEARIHDPNTAPYLIYQDTLSRGKKNLEELNLHPVIRPWLQAFSIANIYGCGSRVVYDRERFRAQIRASEKQEVYGWMAWNASARYPPELFNKK